MISPGCASITGWRQPDLSGDFAASGNAGVHHPFFSTVRVKAMNVDEGHAASQMTIRSEDQIIVELRRDIFRGYIAPSTRVAAAAVSVVTLDLR